MVTKITCYACSTIEECQTCGQEVEKEGITYNLSDYDLEIQAESVLYGTCPKCGSHRTDW